MNECCPTGQYRRRHPSPGDVTPPGRGQGCDLVRPLRQSHGEFISHIIHFFLLIWDDEYRTTCVLSRTKVTCRASSAVIGQAPASVSACSFFVCQGNYVACLTAMLQLMEEEHYRKYIAHFNTSSELLVRSRDAKTCFNPFTPCSLTRNITSHSMKNLSCHSLLRWKMIILPIRTTSLIDKKKVGGMFFWNLGAKGFT